MMFEWMLPCVARVNGYVNGVGTQRAALIGCISLLLDDVSTNIRNINHLSKYYPLYFTFIKTFKDNQGHWRTLKDIQLLGCIIFALRNQLIVDS